MRLEPIRVDGATFITTDGRPFFPYGVQVGSPIDLDNMRIKWWVEEEMTAAFSALSQNGHNCCRFITTFGRAMRSLTQPNVRWLEQLKRVADMADRYGIYLDLTINGFFFQSYWHDWWETASEPDRWASCGVHAASVAQALKGHPAILCLDLVSEPSINDAGNNHGGYQSGYYYILYIANEVSPPGGGTARSNTKIATDWMDVVATAAKQEDPERLLTVGLLPLNLQTENAFAAHPLCDYVSLHDYPADTDASVNASLALLNAFTAHGKPIVMEEFGGTMFNPPSRRARQYVITASREYNTYCWGGLSAQAWEPPGSSAQTAMDITRRFNAPDSPQVPGEGVLWLSPDVDSAKTWTTVPAGQTAWSILRGGGELPPSEPQLGAVPSRDLGGIPLPTTPMDLTRKLTTSSVPEKIVCGFTPCPALYQVIRVELWVYAQVRMGANFTPGTNVSIKLEDGSNNVWAETTMYAYFDEFPPDWYRIGPYRGPMTANEINNLTLVIVTENYAAPSSGPGATVWTALAKVVYAYPDPPAALRLGRMQFPVQENELTEQIGSAVETSGTALIASERKLRSFNPTFPLRPARKDADFDKGWALRRQVRSLMSNDEYRQSGLFFGARADPQLQAYVVPGQGDLTYDQGGIPRGEFKLELSDVQVVAPRSLVRAARQVHTDLGVWGGTTPRDYLGRFYSLDYVTTVPISVVYLPVGATDIMSDSPVPVKRISKASIDGPQPIAVGRVSLDVLHYELAVEDEGKGDVTILDTRGTRPTPAPTESADKRPAVGYGWEEVYGPDYDLTGVPVLQNGLCRLRWIGGTSNAGYFALDSYLIGVGFREAGGILLSGDGVNFMDRIQSVTVAEYTPERAVLRVAMRDSSGLWRGEVYVTLARGWSGPRVELYARSGLDPSYPNAADITWVPFSAGTAWAAVAPGTTSQATASDTGTWAGALLGSLTDEGWAALVPVNNFNAPIWFAFMQSGIEVYAVDNARIYGSNRKAIEFYSTPTQAERGYLSVRFTCPAWAASTPSRVSEAESIRFASGTSSQVGDAAASGGQAIEDSQTAATADTLRAIGGGPSPGLHSVFARVRVVTAGATGKVQTGFTGSSSTSSGQTTFSNSTYAWVYVGDAFRKSAAHPWWVRIWRSAGSGVVRIDRVIAIPVEMRDDPDSTGFDGARDIVAASLADCRQVATFVDR